jgi:predicted ATP-binding protein involved in virulence
MEENFNNKISRLELGNFTCFAKAEMDFSSGIDVFIGENGVGKTHILKALYSMLRKGWIGGDSEDAAKFRVGTNFKEIYKPKKALKTTCFQGF